MIVCVRLCPNYFPFTGVSRWWTAIILVVASRDNVQVHSQKTKPFTAGKHSLQFTVGNIYQLNVNDTMRPVPRDSSLAVFSTRGNAGVIKLPFFWGGDQTWC